MPILASELKFYLSGGAANSDPNAALGGAISSVEIGAGLSNLFDTVSSAEASSGDTEYRCLYVKNTNGTLTLQAAKTWVAVAATLGFQIGLDPAGVNGTATTVANESTAPAGVTFGDHASEGAAASIGDMAAGAYQAVWVKRTCNASQGALASDGPDLRLKGDFAG